jgi:hypothetical protein
MLPTWALSCLTIGVFSPLPQQLEISAVSACSINASWVIGTNVTDSAGLFAAQDLQRALNSSGLLLSIVSLQSVSPTSSSFVAMGTSSDANMEEIMAGSSIPMPQTRNPEGYSLDACTKIAQHRIIIVGNTRAGVFYGAQTLKQAVNAPRRSSTSTSVVLKGLTITDWPDMETRGVHVHGLGDKAPPLDNFYEQADKMAAHKMNLFSAFTVEGVTENTSNARHGELLLTMQSYSLQRHLEFVPCIDLGKVLPQDARTGEGFWARNVPFTVDPSGLLVPDTPPILPLLNGDFERGLEHWSLWPQSNPSSRGQWTLLSSSADCFRGEHCVSLTVDASTTAPVNLTTRILSSPVPVHPGRAHQLSIFTNFINGTKLSHRPWVWLVQIDSEGAEIHTIPTGIQPTNTAPGKWRQDTITFVTDRSCVAVRVYAGAVMVNAPLHLLLDEILIIGLDHALSNVIRTTVTDVIVRQPGSLRNDTAARYTEGVDYTLVSASALLTTTVDFRAHMSNGSSAANVTRLDDSLLTLLKSTSATGAVGATSVTNTTSGIELATTSTRRLQPGQKVLIDYDFQPGSMGLHDYGVYRGLPDHFPYPPNATAQMATSQRAMRTAAGGYTGGYGSPHTDFKVSGSFCGCFEEPLYYEIALNLTIGLVDFFKKDGMPLKYINLDYDELRAIARDSRTLTSGKTNAELLAGSMNRIVRGLHTAHPEVRVLFWDDMLNPWHLHASDADQDDLQAQWYGREDKTLDTALALVMPEDRSSVVWLDWFYSYPFSNARINGSVAMEHKAGFEVWGCPNEDYANIECWARALAQPFGQLQAQTTGAHAGAGPQLHPLGPATATRKGMIDTDWRSSHDSVRYVGLQRTAEMSWHYLHNASVTCGF